MEFIEKMDEGMSRILDASEVLFLEKGFPGSSLNDILFAAGVGRGTFFYYFESKEELLNQIVLRNIGQILKVLEEIASSVYLSVPEKMFKIINYPTLFTGKKDQMIQEIYLGLSAEMRQKVQAEIILQLTPILTKIVKNGIEESVFNTPYPQESIEVMLVASQFLFDDGIFKWTYEEKVAKLKCFIRIFELALGAEPGSFSYFNERLEKLKSGN